MEKLNNQHTYYTRLVFEQGENLFGAECRYNESKKLWEVTVYVKDGLLHNLEGGTCEETFLTLEDYSLSFNVEWQALEYATRIRSEPLVLPEGFSVVDH